MKSFILPLFVCMVFCACHTTPPQQAHLPNIVLIIGDDHGYPYFGFMGADYVHTPHMDALAESGTVFTQGYVPANHCRPSLQSILTGTLPIDHNREVEKRMNEQLAKKEPMEAEKEGRWKRDFRHHAMKDFPTLPKLLKEKGYVSFQGGKWWEFHYENGGFDQGMTTGWTEEDRKSGNNWFKKFMGGTGLELGRKTQQPVYDFIDAHTDQPFFIWYAPELPHYPLNAPQQYYDLYADKEMTESAKRYYANCTWFDTGVGELMQYLKEKDEFSNTLFVYVNDNGWEQNPDQEFRADSMRWHNGGDKGKLSMYDPSFRTPIIFSWEGSISAGNRKTDLIHSVDIPATLLDYVGVDVPAHVEGQSYKEVIEGGQQGPRSEIIGKIDNVRSEDNMMGQKLEGYWLRNENWFFNWDATHGIVSLFDMHEDPQNTKNLADEFPDLVAGFSKKLSKWKTEKGR